jgi:hypothetical protein
LTEGRKPFDFAQGKEREEAAIKARVSAMP